MIGKGTTLSIATAPSENQKVFVESRGTVKSVHNYVHRMTCRCMVSQTDCNQSDNVASTLKTNHFRASSPLCKQLDVLSVIIMWIDTYT